MSTYRKAGSINGNETPATECPSLGAGDATQIATTPVSSPVMSNETSINSTPKLGENNANDLTNNLTDQLIKNLQQNLAEITEHRTPRRSLRQLRKADKKVIKAFKRLTQRYFTHFTNQEFHLCMQVQVELQTCAFYNLLRYTILSDNYSKISAHSQDFSYENIGREVSVFEDIQDILNLCYAALDMGITCEYAADYNSTPHSSGYDRFSYQLNHVVVPKGTNLEGIDWECYFTPLEYLKIKCNSSLALTAAMAIVQKMKHDINPSQLSQQLTEFMRQAASCILPCLTRPDSIPTRITTRVSELHLLLTKQKVFENLMYNEYASFQQMVDAESQALFSVNHTVAINEVSHNIAESLRTTIGTFFEKLSENLMSTYNFTKTVVSGIAICLILWYALDYVSSRKSAAHTASGILVVLSIIAQFVLAKALAARVVSLVGTIIEMLKEMVAPIAPPGYGVVNAVPQSNFLNSGIIATLVILTTLLITGRSDLNTDKIINRVVKIPALAKAGTSIFDAFSPTLEYINDECVDKIFGCKFDWNSGVDPEVERYQENVTKIVQWHSEKTTMKSSVLQTLIQETEMQGLRLLQSPKLKEMRPAIMAQHQIIKKIVDECGARGIHLRGQRHPPTIIYLYGGTSCGKSTILETLALKMARAMAEVDGIPLHTLDRKDLIYSRAPEQEFWDGYRGQPICLFDDFCQKKDFAQVPNLELFEIIRAGNTAEMPLHMAELADKNTSYFKSKIVILTSNLAVPKIESLAAPEALLRRIDIAVEVKRATMLNGEPVLGFNPDAVSFRPYTMKGGKKEYKVAPQRMSLDDLVEAATVDYRKKFGFEASRKQYNAALELEMGWRNNPLPNQPLQKKTINQKVKDFFKNIWEEEDMAVNVPPVPAPRRLSVQAPQPELEGEQSDEEEEERPEEDEDPIRINTLGQLSDFEEEYDQYPDDFRNERSRPESPIDGESQMWPFSRSSSASSLSSAVSEEEGSDVDQDEYEEEREILISTLIEIGRENPSLFRQLKWKAVRVNIAYLDWKRKMQLLYEDNKVMFQVLGLGAALVAVAGIGLMVKKAFFTQESVPVAVEGETAYEPGKTRFIQRRAANKLTRVVKKVAAQGEAADTCALQLCSSLATRNLYIMKLDGQPLGGCFFLKNRTLIFPKHYLNFLLSHSNSDDSVIELRGHTATSRILTKDFVRNAVELFEPVMTSAGLVSPDVCHVQIPSAHAHRDISHLFVRREAAEKCDKVNVILCGNSINDKGNLTMWSKFCTGDKFSRFPYEVRSEASLNLPYKHYEIDTWQYYIATQRGDCGSLLVINDPAYKDKILGMHSLGVPSQDRGFSIPLFYEDFQELLAEVKDPSVPSEDFVRGDSNCELPFPGDFEYVQPAEYPHTSPTQSKLCKTPLHPDNDIKSSYTSNYTPALLHSVNAKNIGVEPNDGEMYNPLYYRLAKCGLSAKCVDEKLLTWSKNQYLSELLNLLSHNGSPLLKSRDTFETACKGIPGYRYINSINRSSSPGYGWIPKKGYPGKQTWFGSGPEFDMVAAAPVEKAVENILQKAAIGKRTPVVFTDNLKDEKKPKHKWYKTRVFSACPMDYYIACKVMYQGVVGLLTQHRNYTGISVGTNVYSEEWDIMVKILTQHTENLIAGDFEGFDSSLLTAILWEAQDILNQLCKLLPDYDPEHDKIRDTLFCDLVNSYHCAESNIYMWTHSLPSGHYLTAIVNSIYVNLVFRYICLQASQPSTEFQARRDLEQLRMVSYGDDHIVAIPPALQSKITQNSLVNYFKQIGMTYTDETKSDREVPDFRKITDLTYLKRKFRYESRVSRFVAPLQLDVVLESVMWQRRSQGSWSNLQQQIINCLAELALHGQKTFDQHYKLITDASLRTIQWTPGLPRDRLEYIYQLAEEEEERNLL